MVRAAFVGWSRIALACFAATLAAQRPVAVTVVDEAGRPLQGAAVEVVESGRPPTALGATDAAGHLAATVTCGTDAELFVAASGRGGAATSMAGLGADGWTAPVVLARGVMLVGRVRDASGRAIAGAEVRAEPLRSNVFTGADWASVTRASSETSGIFRLQGAAENNLRLAVTAPGHFDASLAPVVLGTPLELTLEPSGSIHGVVVDGDGKPVAADLAVEYEGEPARQHGRSGADGTFALTWRKRAWCRVYARLGPPTYAFAVSAVLTGWNDEVRLVLRPATELRAVHVQVTGDGGAPITDYRACIGWYGDNEPDYAWTDFARAQRPTSAGLCCLPPPNNDMTSGTLLVVAPGRATTFAKVEWAPDANGVVAVTVPTVAERTLRGSVVDRDGKAIADAKVWVRIENRANLGVMSDAVSTAADGTFVLAGLAVGRCYVHCAVGRALLRPRRVEVRADGEPAAVRFEVAAKVAAHGRIKGGEPSWRLGFVASKAAAERSADAYSTQRQFESEAVFAGDGTFAVALQRDSLYLPLLAVPRPAHRGGWLLVGAPVLRTGTEASEELVIDASIDRPGLVRGKVTMLGSKLPPERLLVEQLPVAVTSSLQMIAGIEDALGWVGVSAVGRDGTFEMQSAPGKHMLRVIDVLSGVVLARTEQPIEVEGGATLPLTLTVTAAEVRLELVDVEAGDRGPAFALRYQKVGERQGIWAAPWLDRVRGVNLRDSLTSTVLYVPATGGELRVVAGELPEPDVFGGRDVTPWSSAVRENAIDSIAVAGDPTRPITVRVEVPRRRFAR